MIHYIMMDLNISINTFAIFSSFYFIYLSTYLFLLRVYMYTGHPYMPWYRCAGQSTNWAFSHHPP